MRRNVKTGDVHPRPPQVDVLNFRTTLQCRTTRGEACCSCCRLSCLWRRISLQQPVFCHFHSMWFWGLRISQGVMWPNLVIESIGFCLIQTWKHNLNHSPEIKFCPFCSVCGKRDCLKGLKTGRTQGWIVGNPSLEGAWVGRQRE